MKQLIDILEMGDEEFLLQYVAEVLRPDAGAGTLHVTDDYVYLDTGHPICLMAHLDTVNITHVKVEVTRRILRNSVLAQPLGADDRAGVFAALRTFRILKERKDALPSLLFTTQEESGGLGARKFVEDDIFNNDETFLVLALDRKGASEYVDYTRQPREVEQYVESFGFERKIGSYNDVLDLNAAYNVPGVNLSVGYYGQHTGSEKLHIDELFLTISRLITMCNDPIPVRHQLERATNWRANRGTNRVWGGHQNRFDDYDDGWSSYSKGPVDKSERKPRTFGLPPEHMDDVDAVASFFNLVCDEGAYSKHVCPQCKVTWMNCRCGFMLDTMRAELTLDQRELVDELWLYASDPICTEFKKQLLEDIVDDDYIGPGGEQEEEDEPPITEVLH
jgi:hypothetical protein